MGISQPDPLSNTPSICRASVHRYTLLDALKSLKSAVDKSPTLPVLANILIQGTGTTLTLSATNLQTIQQTSVDAHIDTSSFAVAVSYQTLYELVKLLDDAQINLIADSKTNRLTIKQEWYQARLVMTPIDEFPTIASFDANTAQHLATIADFAQLKTIVSHISTFCQKPSKRGDRSSYEYMKLTVHTEGIQLTCANTNGMSSAHLEVETHIDNNQNIYIDPKAFRQAVAVMASDKDAFAIYLTQDNMLALQNGVRITLIQVADEVALTIPQFVSVATAEVDYTTLVSVLKSAKRNRLLHIDMTADLITFASDKLTTPFATTFKPVVSTDNLMLVQNLCLSLELTSTLVDFERGLRWRKGTKKASLTPTLHLIIDPRDDELVLGVSGRHNTLDVVSIGIRLNEQGQRWYTFKQMKALQIRYLETSRLMSVVPTEYASADVKWSDVPAELKAVREAKTKQHNINRDMNHFVAQYPCWTKEEIIAEL